MLAQTTHHKFSVQEYLALYDKGIVPATPKTELINGEIVELSPLGHRHAKTQQLIQNFLRQALARDDVFITGSIIASEHSMPEPDVYVLKPQARIQGNFPTADQVLMVVEVADSTLNSDLVNNGGGKLGIYAQAGIARVWVVDVNNTAIHDFESPAGAIFQSCKVHLGSLTLGQHSVLVSQLIAG